MVGDEVDACCDVQAIGMLEMAWQRGDPEEGDPLAGQEEQEICSLHAAMSEFAAYSPHSRPSCSPAWIGGFRETSQPNGQLAARRRQEGWDLVRGREASQDLKQGAHCEPRISADFAAAPTDWPWRDSEH